MADFIDREQVYTLSKKVIDALNKNGGKFYITLADEILDEIDNLPSADVKPVVHGHWIRKKTEVWKKDGNKAEINVYADFCSVCGSFGTRELDNFCPNCGARMDEDG